MKKLSILFFLFFSSLLFSQNRVPIKGKLIYRNVNVVAANVVNNTAQINTITDANGEFDIDVFLNDEIIFSSVQYQIKAVKITEQILSSKRLVVSINEKITELEEVVITPDNQEKFLDLKEEEFRGYDYTFDKSTKVVNTLTDDRQFTDGLNIVNIAKLISSIIGSKNEVEKEQLKASEVLPYVFRDDFFINDLNLKQDQILGFLEYVDSKLPSQKLLQVSQQFQLINFLIIESENYKNQL
ncbi:MAG: carboxypeptidase-like regulatory domain-containing protein [Bacteroidota bacterium]|nr:carboxypeptidase-like regulatory domain-containing protein [Bacteroidota bacterium]